MNTETIKRGRQDVEEMIKPSLHDYFKMRNGWVSFKGSKKKIKLRKYISDFATKLSDLNDEGYKHNRDKLIASFEQNNLQGISDHYNKEIKEFIERRNSIEVTHQEIKQTDLNK